MEQAAQGPFRTGLRVPPILPLPWDFPDLPTFAQTIPLPEMLPIPHPARPSSGDTTSESPQCSPMIQYTGCIPGGRRWPQAGGRLWPSDRRNTKGKKGLCSFPQVTVVPLAPQPPGRPPEANLEFPGREEEPPSSLEEEGAGFPGILLHNGSAVSRKAHWMDTGPP